MILNRRRFSLGLLATSAAAVPRVAWGENVDRGVIVDLPPQAVTFGSTGRIISFGPNQPHKTIAAALAVSKAGDVVQYPANEPRGQVFGESVGVPDCVTLDLGGILKGGGTAAPIWTAGAILDGSNVLDPIGYIAEMGGVVALGSMLLKGAEVRGFGMQEITANGTAGVRAAGSTIGRIYIDHCHIYKNQNGIGPGGLNTSLTITNSWLHDSQLDPTGQCHNVYAASAVTVLVVGPAVTSTQSPLPQGGGGHALKSRATNYTELVGPSYIYSADASCLDIPDGSAHICPIGDGVILVKTATDRNSTVIGYCTESKRNGVSGVQCEGVTISADCLRPNIINKGPVSFDASCKFAGNALLATDPSLATGIPGP